MQKDICLGKKEAEKIGKLKIVRNLPARNIDMKKTRALMSFLKLYVHFANTQTSIKFEETINILTGNKITMGIEEMVLERAKKQGEEKGLKKGKGKMIEKLIIKTKLSDQQIAEIAELPVDFIKKIRRELKK